MTGPTPHEIATEATLTKLGIVALDDPRMRVLGAKTVTREIDARNALEGLAKLLAEAAVMEDLDDFDPGHLTDAANAVIAYQRARRELLRLAHQ